MGKNSVEPDQLASWAATMFFNLKEVYVCLIDSLRPSQQFFSHVGADLPGLNQYYKSWG